MILTVKIVRLSEIEIWRRKINKKTLNARRDMKKLDSHQMIKEGLSFVCKCMKNIWLVKTWWCIIRVIGRCISTNYLSNNKCSIAVNITISWLKVNKILSLKLQLVTEEQIHVLNNGLLRLWQNSNRIRRGRVDGLLN